MAPASPSLAVFDLDRTLSRGDTFLAYLAAVLRRRPARLARAWRLPLDTAWHLLGGRDNGWLKERYLRALLGGLPRPALDAHTAAFLARLLAGGLRPAALERLREHQARGDRVLLATASPDLYVEPLAAALGIAEVVCTRTAWSGDTYRGHLVGGNCYGRAKLERVQALVGDGGGGRRIVYSDHHDDLPLLEWADRGVAVSPTRRLARLARARGLEVAAW